MQKRTSFIYLIFAIFFLFSCKVDVANTSLVQKPDISLTDKQVTLMIPKVNSQTFYINIYRQDVTDPNNPGEVLNIGLLYPTAYKADNQTYDFIDFLVTQNRTYIYKVKYLDVDGIYYSNWSNAVKIDKDFEKAYPETKKLTYTTSSTTRFSYDETNYSLLLNKPLQNPEIESFTETYQPMIIVNNGLSSQVFKISHDSLSNIKAPITLKDRLPDSFLDTNIVIEGILAQIIEYVDPKAEEDKLEIKTVHWTAPTKIPVKGYTDNIIKIKSSHANTGLDYSHRAK